MQHKNALIYLFCKKTGRRTGFVLHFFLSLRASAHTGAAIPSVCPGFFRLSRRKFAWDCHVASLLAMTGGKHNVNYVVFSFLYDQAETLDLPAVFCSG